MPEQRHLLHPGDEGCEAQERQKQQHEEQHAQSTLSYEKGGAGEGEGGVRVISTNETCDVGQSPDGKSYTDNKRKRQDRKGGGI